MAKIPDFETRQDAAEFWDTHDSTEYLDDMEEIDVEVNLRRNIFYPKTIILSERPSTCVLCNSDLIERRIQYGHWHNERLLIINHVPIFECSQNCHMFLLAEIAEQIDQLLDLDEHHKLNPTTMMSVPVVNLAIAA